MTRAERPALEAAFLRYAWYINELYDAVFGRPSERLAAFCATVVDPKVIDGAVNGVADLVRERARPCDAPRPDTCATTCSASSSGRCSSSPSCSPGCGGADGDASSPSSPCWCCCPAGAAVVVALVPTAGWPPWLHEALGLPGGRSCTLAVAVAVAVEFKTGDGGYQLVSDHIWAPSSASAGTSGSTASPCSWC